jgi:hypothetical protein
MSRARIESAKSPMARTAYDRHMLKAARHFHLTGVNVISQKG